MRLATLVAVSLLAFASCHAGPNPATATFTGFKQFWKCPDDNDVQKLGDKGSQDACLTACRAQPLAAGCWYLDGTGGFPRDCRICLTKQPVKETYGNDFAGAFE